jgi:hypothetical protein
MDPNEVSLLEASDLLTKLLTESIPVLAFYKSADGSETILRGFVDSITAEAGLLVSGVKGEPGASSTLSVPLPGDRLGADCRFGYEDKRVIEESRREGLAAKYGDTALVIFLPSGSRLSLMFQL